MSDKDLKLIIHDLNNQLQLIVLYNKKAIKYAEESPEKTLTYLTKIRDVTDEIGAMLKDVISPDDEILNFKEYLFLIKLDFEEKYNLSVSIGGDVDMEIRTSLSEVKRVFENICKNAQEAKATSILVHFNNNGVLFSDNGIGISPPVIKKLNSGERCTDKDDGHGLGTQMVRQFCDKNSMKLSFANKKKNIMDKNSLKGTHVIMRKK